MTIRTVLLAICVLLSSALPVVSKGSSPVKDDAWNPEQISVLPVEVRQYISGICKGPAQAQHDFATYLPSDKRWRINLEYLRCDGLGKFRHGSLCLDVDFVAVGAHFRLANKQDRGCGF